MDRLRTAGVFAVVFALAGYGAGVVVPYPGRAFSITLFMLGATLAVVGGAG